MFSLPMSTSTALPWTYRYICSERPPDA